MPFIFNQAWIFDQLGFFGLRIFKLFLDLQLQHLKLRLVKLEQNLFFIATFFILYIASVGIYYFENQAQENFGSIFHSLDGVFAVTVGGKTFTSIIVLIGIGIVAVEAITRTITSSKEK